VSINWKYRFGKVTLLRVYQIPTWSVSANFACTYTSGGTPPLRVHSASSATCSFSIFHEFFISLILRSMLPSHKDNFITTSRQIFFDFIFASETYRLKRHKLASIWIKGVLHSKNAPNNHKVRAILAPYHNFRGILETR